MISGSGPYLHHHLYKFISKVNNDIGQRWVQVLAPPLFTNPSVSPSDRNLLDLDVAQYPLLKSRPVFEPMALPWDYLSCIFHDSVSGCVEPRLMLYHSAPEPWITFTPMASSLMSPLVLRHPRVPVGQPTWIAHCHLVFNITKMHSTVICWVPTKSESVLVIAQQTI